jgi:DNA helicase-2/ATP-dependent DNA helicase PcrA
VAEQYSQLEPGKALALFLERVSLVSDVDAYDENAQALTLITLHQAKGLEFPVVFIVGMEEGVLPHYRSFDDPAQMEEERRLCYVGVTRAEQRLYLLRAYRRHLMGGSSLNLPSRFLKDVPQHLIVSNVQHEDKYKERHPSQDMKEITEVHLPEFKAGDRVRHGQFGEGVVVDYQAISNDAEVLVDFEWTGIKKLLFSFAKLEKMS